MIGMTIMIPQPLQHGTSLRKIPRSDSSDSVSSVSSRRDMTPQIPARRSSGIDVPTGNIKVGDAKKIINNTWVEEAIPLAYGDNFEKPKPNQVKEEHEKFFPFSLPSFDLKEMVKKMYDLERKETRLPCFFDSLRSSGYYPNELFFNRRRFELTAFALHYQ